MKSLSSAWFSLVCFNTRVMSYRNPSVSCRIQRLEKTRAAGVNQRRPTALRPNADYTIHDGLRRFPVTDASGVFQMYSLTRTSPQTCISGGTQHWTPQQRLTQVWNDTKGVNNKMIRENYLFNVRNSSRGSEEQNLY